MGGKEYLGQLKNGNLRIQVLEKQKRKLMSGKGNFESLTDKVMDIQAEIDNKIDGLLALKKVIINSLDVVENNLYYAILFEKYVNLSTWEKMAEIFNYDYKHLQRMHLKALAEYERHNKHLFEKSEVKS